MDELVSDGVRFLGARALSDAPGSAGLQAVEVTYLVGDAWKVTLVADLRSESGSDFARLTFEPGDGGSPTEGINSGLLRLIPFRHAKTQVDQKVLEAWSDEAQEIPPECSEPREYAAMAVAYEDFVSRFPEQPLKKMEDLSKIPKSTLSARVAKAKVLGYLSREGRTGPYKATDMARELLYG